MALNTVEVSSFITKGLGLAQPFNIQAGTLGCFFCNLVASHGKTPMPCRKLCSGAKQAVYLCHTLVPALSGCESFLLSCLTPPFSGCDIEVHLNVQISPSRTRGSLHLLCSYRVTRHSLQSKPLFLSSGRWFLSETLLIVRYCLSITEAIDCTSLWRSPGMISSCTELSEAKNDMSVD